MAFEISVYLDLDGVLADYNEGIRAFGFTPDPALNRSSHLLPGSGSAKKREMYEAVKGTTFYADLPLLPDAIQLYNGVLAYDADPAILTAAPKFGASEDDYFLNPHWLGAAFHKRNWVEHKLLPTAAYARAGFLERIKMKSLGKGRIRIRDEHFVCTTSARKFEYIGRKHSDHQILIDDRIDNCEAWRAAGGTAIQHTDTETTLSALESYVEALREEVYRLPS